MSREFFIVCDVCGQREHAQPDRFPSNWQTVRVHLERTGWPEEIRQVCGKECAVKAAARMALASFGRWSKDPADVDRLVLYAMGLDDLMVGVFKE